MVRMCPAHRLALREVGETLECPRGHRPAGFVVVDRRTGRVEAEVPADEAAEETERQERKESKKRAEEVTMAAPGGPGGKTELKAKFNEPKGEILWIRVVTRKPAAYGGTPVHSVCWSVQNGPKPTRTSKGTVGVFSDRAEAAKVYEKEVQTALGAGWLPAPILSGRMRIAPIPAPGTLAASAHSPATPRLKAPAKKGR